VSVVLLKTAHAPTSLILIHDSIEHKPTALSLKFGGSASGHIRSLIAALGTKDFYRLRLGIGRPESNVADYVLTRLPNFERQFWAPDGPGLELVWEQIQRIALRVKQGQFAYLFPHITLLLSSRVSNSSEDIPCTSCRPRTRFQKSFFTRYFAGKNFRGNLLSVMTLDLPRITVYFRVDSSETVDNWATAEHRILVTLMDLNAYILFPLL
jgi:hypothetical protein